MPLFEIAPYPLEQFKKAIKAADSKEVAREVELMQGGNLFHTILALDVNNETTAKIAFLFQEAKRLKLNPNQHWDSNIVLLEKELGCSLKHLDWGNTPISECISYETLGLIPFFLQEAKKNGFVIDLNIKDKGGKTPFMFALRLGWVPIDLLTLLITLENYNKPDKLGMTPLMVACALRRVDVAKLIIQFEADRLKLGKLDFSAITPEQRQKLSPFIQQTHKGSGKSLGHYALLRSGVRFDQDDKNRDENYQDSVLNILKTAGVDGLRDENARWNSIVSARRETLSDIPGCTATAISYVMHISYCNKAFLNSKDNLERAIRSNSTFVIKNAKHLHALRAQFSGVSLVDSIIARTQPMVEFLAHTGLNFSKTQTNGKTMAQYVDGLITAQANPTNAKLISDADKKYVCPLKTIVEGFEAVQKQNPHNPAVAAGQGAEAKGNGLVAAAAKDGKTDAKDATQNPAGATVLSDVHLLLKQSVIAKANAITPAAAVPANVEAVTLAASIDSGSQAPSPKQSR